MAPLRIQAFFHAPFEGLGAITHWANESGYEVLETHWYKGQTSSQLRSGDFVIIMGGPMGVHDEAELPWLRAEKQAIAVALALRCPMLGICLGAQLIAHVLGASVTKNKNKEIGWWPIERNEAAKATWLWKAMPERLTTFHWHGDTFALPPNAYWLYASEGCSHQAFLSGDRVMGLQFHPEMEREGIQALLTECVSDLTPSPFVQSESQIRGEIPDLASNRRLLHLILSGLVEQVEMAPEINES